MVSDIFQVQVFRPAEVASTTARIAESASFARQLGRQAAVLEGSGDLDPTDARSASAPWLRTAGKRTLAASIERAASSVGVSPALAVAVAIAESSLDPTAVAADGLSSGTFQVRPSTADDMRQRIREGALPRPAGVDDVSLGIAYLRHLDELFSTATEVRPGLSTVAVADATERRRFAVAAFNAGQGRVASAQARAARAGGDPTRFEDVRPHLPTITQGYVERVTRHAAPSASRAIA